MEQTLEALMGHRCDAPFISSNSVVAFFKLEMVVGEDTNNGESCRGAVVGVPANNTRKF